jgi:hypothetical protein
MSAKHRCTLCRKHVSEVFEVAKKTGSRRTYCARCLETLKAKGAKVGEAGPSTDELAAEKARAATASANLAGTNFPGDDR